MFSLFKKDPEKKLQKKYEQLMKDAVDAQRSGDIEGYSNLSTQADNIAKELDKIKADKEAQGEDITYLPLTSLSAIKLILTRESE